ncbi:hypothetical protein FF36_00478 [Frankia torreyi]|uniref:MmyB-like transcription regulator ligand binding domain-containing protein n=1 Tax=Frankia torreyi TaxID=1856 RepID=A0A0D8BMN1_9ACTN|nr:MULTISPECIES: hypothetical protein [Frankia]KJE25345.1 hypothetical protein FF36_00478 [Frankia torreyi]KQC37158.1 hypothetical protein UK82_17090 [Frankia sp. ACN1ag]KQM07839.1 hypothetical protein FF86_100195 [Frankia sp. CpI1-P]
MEKVDRGELAAFLRHRRARLQPDDVGLEAGYRRRTPGLRRQEVAQLAGMSVEYYIRTRPGARQRHDATSAEQFARESVADLRAAAARYPHDAGIRDLVRRLLDASDDFGRLWNEHEVRVRRSTRKRLNHPDVGWLDLDCDALHDPERDQWIILYSAAPGTPTHRALQLLKVIGTQRLGAPAEPPQLRS